MTWKRDIECDNLRHPEIYGLGRIFVPDDFTQGAIAMLKLIGKDHGWEESENYYYNKFLKWHSQTK